MTRRQAAVLLTLTFFASIATNPQCRADETRPPNIVFVFADDQCPETIAALGNDEIRTPNLDSLVSQGVSFSRAYNMGGWHGAVCVASRTMLQTGRFLWNAHAVEPRLAKERDAGRLWSERLRRAGYRTYMTGKWHVKLDPTTAFDVAVNVRGGMPAQTDEGYDRPRDDRPDPWDPSDPRFGGFWKGGTHWSEVVADDAVSFIDDAKNRDRPFFLYLAFNAPHDPRQSPRRYVDMYPADRIRVPKNFLTEYPFKDGIGCGPGLRDEKLAPFPRTERAVQVHRQEYYAIISHMDEQIGRIITALEEANLRDNTWIVFTADHGLAVGQHGLMGKQNMYEHSMRAPFVIIGPEAKPGTVIDAPIYLQDVMPTTLELAGIDTPQHVQFQSLLPLLRGEAKSLYDSVYGAYIDLQRMAVVGDYKLILYPKIGRKRLYNLKDDPDESRDLADDPRHQSTVRRLFARLLKLQQETGDALDLRAAFPDL